MTTTHQHTRIDVLTLFILSLFTAAAGTSASAQEKAMSLRDCIVYAGTHSTSNAKQALYYKNARINQLSNAMSFMPSISAGSSASMNFGRGIDPETNTYATKQSLHNGYSLSLSMPVFDGLVRINRYRAARLATLQQQKQNTITADATSLNVITYFYHLIYYRELVKQVETQLLSDRERLRQCERQEQLGVKSGADVDQMRANVATDEYALVNQQNMLDLAIMDLKAAMNYPLDSTLVADGTLDLRVDPISPHLGGATDVDLLVDLNPKIERARLALEESRYNLKASRGSYSPTISFSANVSTSYYKTINFNYDAEAFAKQLNNNLGEGLSLSVSIPIFDRLSTINSHRRAKVSYHIQQLEYADARFNIEREIRQAEMELEGARREYLSAEARLQAVKTSHHANERKFELGSISALDLYTSSSNLANAQATVVGKQIQYIIRRITMDYYLGKPLLVSAER